MKEKLSASLKQLSSLKIGGLADIYYPENAAEFIELINSFEMPIVIGSGSNSVFEDGVYQRPVICTSLLNKVENKDDLTYAEAGVKLGALFDFAAGTPATVGGGILNNYGAFGHQLFDYLETVELIEKGSDKATRLKATDIQYGYRYTSLKENKHRYITGGYFQQIRPKKELQIFLEQRKLKQVSNFPNAGSLFKNPPGDYAGRLLEESGLKGFAIGGLQLWSGHANILINKNQGSFSDFQELVSQAIEKVEQAQGIRLETEIETISDK
jgi:UDP-N-acetylmuramate dehydrogenase